MNKKYSVVCAAGAAAIILGAFLPTAEFQPIMPVHLFTPGNYLGYLVVLTGILCLALALLKKPRLVLATGLAAAAELVYIAFSLHQMLSAIPDLAALPITGNPFRGVDPASVVIRYQAGFYVLIAGTILVLAGSLFGILGSRGK